MESARYKARGAFAILCSNRPDCSSGGWERPQACIKMPPIMAIANVRAE